MIKTEKQGFIQLFKIAAPFIIFSATYTSLTFVLEEIIGDHIYKISGQIGSVFGLAVAFFLGFRMNSAYDRWWEARKIFGELTNNSNSFIAKLYTYYSNPENFNSGAKSQTNTRVLELLSLTAIYIRQLKNEMHQNFRPSLNQEANELYSKYNINPGHKISNEILLAVARSIEADFARESNMEKADLMQHINRFYEIQGKAERIRNTHFLMIYSAFTKIIVGFYVLLIPLFIGDIDLGGEESGFEFLAVPIMVLISTAFLTINKLANLYGEPFSENITSVSIDEICKRIEQNCNEVKTKIK
ncbi:MAG: hypothetical protein HYZ14_06675 [Bacteroidetes bacterium]|nr:hypothetical protein [Bacteroidota bacterium]